MYIYSYRPSLVTDLFILDFTFGTNIKKILKNIRTHIAVYSIYAHVKYRDQPRGPSEGGGGGI